MHSGALRKWALALTFWLALHVSSLKAQIFTAPLQASTTGTNPVDFEFRADGTLIAKGNSGVGTLLTGDQGSGTRMLWFPKLSAFRVGTVSGTDWDLSNIGQYSIAGGGDTTASGDYSAAFGCGSAATGYVAMTFGIGNTSSGYGSLAAGRFSTASGYGAFALGFGNTSTGVFSMAVGSFTTASAYSAFVTGSYNVGGGTSNSSVATDPAFEIGNGTSSTDKSDAFVVYKNGNVIAQGSIQVAPSGDIPMYTGS